MAIDAVGFDLDYTLAVPERDRSTILSEAAAAVGAPSMSREAYKRAHRRNLTRETRAPTFADLLDDSDADPGELARTYREAVNDALVALPGVEAMLADLREVYPVGLLTNGPALAQRSKLRTLDWEDAFDAVLVSGEIGAGKPDAAAFEALADALGATPGRTAYVGDEPEIDVAGAADAGLRTVQVVSPDGPDPTPRADAHVERDRLADRLPDVLDSL